MRTTWGMEGAEALSAQFEALGNQVATKIGNDVMEQSAELLARRWRVVAPMNPQVRAKTWTLASGERRSRLYGHGRDLIRIGKVRARNEHAVVWKTTTSDAFWLYIYEVGKFDQPARPTFRPATAAMKPLILSFQKEEFQARVASAAEQTVGKVTGGKAPNATGVRH